MRKIIKIFSVTENYNNTPESIEKIIEKNFIKSKDRLSLFNSDIKDRLCYTFEDSAFIINKSPNSKFQYQNMFYFDFTEIKGIISDSKNNITKITFYSGLPHIFILTFILVIIIYSWLFSGEPCSIIGYFALLFFLIFIIIRTKIDLTHFIKDFNNIIENEKNTSPSGARTMLLS